MAQRATCPIEWNGSHQSCLLCCLWDFCPAWLVPGTKCFRTFPCPLSHLCPAGDVHGPATPHSTCTNTHWLVVKLVAPSGHLPRAVQMGKLRQIVGEMVATLW